MSSAMSASSPPTGLMPLSLISEHKTAVPGVPLQRTPEKMNPQPQPTAVLPPQAGHSLRVANGMEGPTPQAAPYPHQQEPSHPSSTVETPGVAMPPLMHHPNTPSAGKGEAASALPQDHRATTEVKTTPSLPPVPEAPLQELRLPTAPGLTITPIIPVSQPVPATPPSLPVPAAQPVQPVVLPAQPIAQPVVAVQPPQQPAPVNQPAIPSGPPPSKEVPSAPPALAPHNVGGSNLSVPPRPTEPKPVVQPERAAEKPAVVPPVANDKPAEQAATPAPIPPSPVPVAKEAAQVPPPAPKPTPPPAEVPSPTPSAPAQPSVQPESKPAPPTPAAVASPSKPVVAAPAQPAPATSAGEPSTAVAKEPAATEPAATPQPSKHKRTPKPKPAPDVEKKTPVKETPVDKDAEGKPRRKRLPTQPYQSPIPELNLIAKISKVEKTPAKPQEDKLIVFYRNEFLAVRNAEGSYYVCQAMQNIYKSSSKIKIRWLSQDPNGENYSPDFYDHTEFDCILTNLNLQRVGKDQFKLPEVEAKRTDSILKRAIDVEQGIVKPDESNITEEHPDGLDLSLYRNEEQLKKRKTSKKSPRATKSARKSLSRTPKPAKPTPEPTKKQPGRGGAAAKRKSAPSPPVSSKRVATPAAKKAESASTATPAKKEAPKKEVATPAAKSAAKRKAAATPASAPPADKKSRRDPASKTKSAAAAASAITPKPSSTSTTTPRRPTRNSK